MTTLQDYLLSWTEINFVSFEDMSISSLPFRNCEHKCLAKGEHECTRRWPGSIPVVMCKSGLHLGFLIQTSVDEIASLFFMEEYLGSCPDLSTSSKFGRYCGSWCWEDSNLSQNGGMKCQWCRWSPKLLFYLDWQNFDQEMAQSWFIRPENDWKWLNLDDNKAVWECQSLTLSFS